MNPVPPPVRIGVVGCGNVLGAYLARVEPLAARGRARITVACGRPGQEKQVTDLGLPRFTTHFEELVADPEVDLVLVLTPVGSHAAVARAALEAGKHVLVEKPLASTLEEADALLTLATRGPGRLLVAPFTPLSPTFRTMVARLRGGEIGRVTAARARYGWSGPDWSPWFYKEGGGVLFDLAVYCVTSLVALLGPVRAVTALVGIAQPERIIRGRPIDVEVEDNVQLVLEHEGGCQSLVTSGFTMQQYRSPALELYGTEGTLQMLGDDWDPDGHELWRADRGAWELYKETDPEWPWTDGLTAMVEALLGGGALPIGPDLARHVLEVLIQARASGRQGRRRAVVSRCAPVALGPVHEEEAMHLVHDRGRRAGG